MKSLILSTATRILMPLILAVSIFVYFRGHNEPGGGFIGGLLAATAFALLEKSAGLEAARKALRVRPLSIAAVGLGCALVSGIWGGIEAGAFLKSVWPIVTVDAHGAKHGLPIGSVPLFDFGVYLVVLGSVCAILFELEEAVATEADRGED